MRRRIIEVLATWPLLVSLLLLLVNDWWLKEAYPSVVTGKLSDFAGLTVVAALLLGAFPNRFRAVQISIAMAFLWWKSPASAPFINFVNGLSAFQVGRVVDYSDLIALSVLPMCNNIVAHRDRLAMPFRGLRRVLVVPVAITTILAVMGTSVIPTRHEYAVRSVGSDQHLRKEEVAEAIHRIATKHRMECSDCSRPLQMATFDGSGMRMSYSLNAEDRTVVFHVEAYPSGLFFGASGEERAEALRNDLKAMFAERFHGLEYVEPLRLR